MVCYIDNNSVRDTAISCSTSNAIGEVIMTKCLELEDRFQLQNWFVRVLSINNPSDWPSRGSTSELLSLGRKPISTDV